MKEVPQSPAPLNNLPASSSGEVSSAGHSDDQVESIRATIERTVREATSGLIGAPRVTASDLDALDAALAPHGYQVDRDHYAKQSAPSPSAEVSRAEVPGPGLRPTTTAEAVALLEALTSRSYAVLPIGSKCSVVDNGRRIRRREARAGTRGRRGARRVRPCPMYLLELEVSRAGELEVLEANVVPVLPAAGVIVE